MIINNFYLIGITVMPFKTNPPLIINTNTPMMCARLEALAGEDRALELKQRWTRGFSRGPFPAI